MMEMMDSALSSLSTAEAQSWLWLFEQLPASDKRGPAGFLRLRGFALGMTERGPSPIEVSSHARRNVRAVAWKGAGSK